MITTRMANERGSANFGWLNSQHSFSFGQYYDPAHMGVSALRVINDDKVSAGAGFSTHGHSNMEIISFVTQGEMIHKDSEGNEQRLPAGEFQLMSAGRGIMHSEYNASATEPLHFLQIWIQPNVQGGQPKYQQKRFARREGLSPVITPDGQNGTLSIKQDAQLSELYLTERRAVDVSLASARRYYVHVISGSLEVNGVALSAGDGATIKDEAQLQLTKHSEHAVHALFFDLP
ncbi:pirin family protein [Alteromonas oceanisediminis]|uniref:pirin family protein n=1 Tax=Alteromonas oceanisediminis TaxID=2836180 RepID=UPI001BDAFA4B|nr:pirin family protein [Alteromonas oceanisediminis]MBT0587670.1 pirin family protein [Alteromonas oceanisediminis]